MIAFLKVLGIYKNFFKVFKGAYLFKTSKKHFSKRAYSSTDSADSLVLRSRLKLSSLKSLKFLYDISLAFAFEKCNLNTRKTGSRKGKKPVKTVSVLKKLFGLYLS